MTTSVRLVSDPRAKGGVGAQLFDAEINKRGEKQKSRILIFLQHRLTFITGPYSVQTQDNLIGVSDSS